MTRGVLDRWSPTSSRDFRGREGAGIYRLLIDGELIGKRITALVWAVALITGCQSQPESVTPWAVRGEFGLARVYVKEHLTQDKSDRRYMLERMRLGILTLADGYAESAGLVFADVYEILRTQGINRDKTVASVVLNEDLKFWKGEPFEQALAMFYYSVQQAMLGSWDNARAAAGNSLFNLRDFGSDPQGQRINTLEIARRAAEYERSLAATDDPAAATQQMQEKERDYFNSGYAVRESNFTLGYLMHGLASQQLGRSQEANDYLAVAMNTDPTIKPLCDVLRAETYNTVLVVAFGLGPEKVGYGPDNALAGFEPRFPSDSQPLLVQVNGQHVGEFPVVCDLNTMAADHMWNNLEDVRLAKSYLGTGLLIAGATATVVGHHEDSREAQWAGLGAILAGLFLKAGAHADTRYCDAIPQRLYLVPLELPAQGAWVQLQVQGQPQSRLVIPGLSANPESPQASLTYVHLPLVGYGVYGDYKNRAAPWAVSGQVYYSNDATGPIEGAQLPYILGGRCVREPRGDALQDYKRWGYLEHMTLTQLEDLYREEGIKWHVEDQDGYAGLHVLEGGDSMVLPSPGTVGFVRLLGQVHPAYKPRTEQAQTLTQEYSKQPPGTKIASR